MNRDFIHYLESVASTNTYLQDIISSILQNDISSNQQVSSSTEVLSTQQVPPTTPEEIREEITSKNIYAVACFRQSAGRGQRGNHWESEADKNIAFSCLLRPKNLPAKDFFLLSQWVSLAICECLSKYLNDITIKWPNDIYYQDKKIIGILIENQLQGSRIVYSIIGIGWNVNQAVFHSDAPNPVSMKQLLHRDFDLKVLCEELYQSLSEHFEAVENGKETPADIREAYWNRLYRKDGYYPFQDEDRAFMGKIVGVGLHGTLMIEHADGMGVRHYAFKEVSYGGLEPSARER